MKYQNSLAAYDYLKTTTKQKYIPVGCVPSAAVTIRGGGGLPQGAVCLPRQCLPGGCVCPGGDVSVCAGGCLPARSPLWTEWQTCVKILPCRNYIADGSSKPRKWYVLYIFLVFFPDFFFKITNSGKWIPTSTVCFRMDAENWTKIVSRIH